MVNSDAAETLAIDPASVSADRIDVIALKLDMGEGEGGRAISLIVKKGTDGAGRPARVWMESVKELYLAEIRVKAARTTITQADIVDLRGTSVCPYVTGLIKQVDTSQLFAQYQSACEQYFSAMTTAFDNYIAEKQRAFDEWFGTLTDTLHVDSTIKKYQYTEQDARFGFTTVAGQTPKVMNAVFTMPEYEKGDLLLLFLGGVQLTEGADYTLFNPNTGIVVITFPNGITVASGADKPPLTAILIKSVVGGSVLSAEIDEINGEVI